MDAQDALDFAHVAPDSLESGVERGQRLAAGVIERLALRGGAHQARRAFQQPSADMTLKVPEVLGDRRLLYANVTGCTGDRPPLDGSDEGA